MVDKFTIIRDLGRFFQRGFFSFPTKDLKRNQVTIPNNWKHKIRKETSQKSPFKIFCFNNGNTTKTKDLQKLFDKEIHCTLQSDNTKHQPVKFISWSNCRYQNLSPGICSKIFTN